MCKLTFFQDNPQVLCTATQYKSGVAVHSNSFHSGLPSERINLSPFTKDFRGGGHTMSLLWICCLAPLPGGLRKSNKNFHVCTFHTLGVPQMGYDVSDTTWKHATHKANKLDNTIPASQVDWLILHSPHYHLGNIRKTIAYYSAITILKNNNLTLD